MELQSRMASGLQSWSPEPEDKPHLTDGVADKQLPLKNRKKKNWWVSPTTKQDNVRASA
jgi:hypothetical protein